MPFLNVADRESAPVELYYEDHGTGQPVVLIHGWPLNGASWERQSAAILAAGHRVVTYDRRGFGRSDQPAYGYDYDTFAADLHAVLTVLNLRGVVLVGFSMGSGEVTCYLGAYGSERISKAVLIAAFPPFLLRTDDNPGGLDGSVFKDVQEAIVADRHAFMDTFLADFYNVDVLGGDRISEQAVRATWNVAVGASAKGTLDCVQAWLTDFRADLSRIDLPTLIIHGDADRALPVETAALPLADRIPGAELRIVAGAPHGLLWTHAAEVNSALLAFLG
ncbi:alpha/beta fold hydrolase [Streptomyces sp. NPDC085466]|uniref:alpha/beta fold hydrolase n=1 Tax=Streptomyces sp. NPDC085466 TaxID=3365725 RepID=UPI0037D2C787